MMGGDGMKINKIVINNFRKLTNNVEVDFSPETFVVGKNNTGKTSLSEIMLKFVDSSRKFKFEDFSSSIVLEENIDNIFATFEALGEDNKNEIEKFFPKISLKIYVEIEDEDNIYKIKPLIFEFENNKDLIINLDFECGSYEKIIGGYKEYNQILSLKNVSEPLSFYNFFKRELVNYYKKNAYITKINNAYRHNIDINEISKLFNIGVISAQREVDDVSEQNNQNISNAIWSYYLNLKKKTVNLNQEDAFKVSLESIKGSLNDEYTEMFSGLLEIINKNIAESNNHKVEITSDFSIEDVLKKNSKIKYKIDNLIMPESYNGLGFSNLMYMIIQLVTFLDVSNKEEKLFNILFIEEPESHLHPQMQSTFLKKVEELLTAIENKYIILTTHSSYLLQSSDLYGVRYFTNGNQGIEVKSLRKFFEDPAYSDFDNFMKKYLKINTCDLFFADKAILVEGTVERMLINALIHKYDQDQSKELSRQHISVVEVGGAYAHIFYDLLSFLNLKTLIITDIDSVKGNRNRACKCDLSEESETLRIKTSNNVIKKWGIFKDIDPPHISEIIRFSKDFRNLILKNEHGVEIRRLTFQRPINDELSWGRTFEEQFIIENVGNDIINESDALKEAINKVEINCEDGNGGFSGEVLKQNVFDIVQEIDKTNFALDLLRFNNWIVPTYIKEGFDWLEQ